MGNNEKKYISNIIQKKEEFRGYLQNKKPKLEQYSSEQYLLLFNRAIYPKLYAAASVAVQ